MLGTDGWLPLLSVAHRGDVAIVQLFLEAEANVPPVGATNVVPTITRMPPRPTGKRVRSP